MLVDCLEQRYEAKAQADKLTSLLELRAPGPATGARAVAQTS